MTGAHCRGPEASPTFVQGSPRRGIAAVSRGWGEQAPSQAFEED